MDFLNDKKNQPIIIGVIVAILLAVGVFLYLQSRPPADAGQAAAGVSQPAGGTGATPGAAPATSAPETTAPAQPGQGAPPQTATTAPAAPSGTPSAAAGTPAGAPAGSKAVAATPVEKFRADPFAMLNPPKKVKTAVVQVREAIPYPTWLIIPKKAPVATAQHTEGDVVDTTPRRMAGVMFGNSVSAIMQTNQETIVVRPGDLIENSTMRVEKIEPTRIVLKSMDNPKKPRYVDVMMAAGLGNPTAATTAAPAPTAPPTRPFPTAPGNRAPRPRGGRGS